MKKKPEKLSLDGEIWSVSDEEFHITGTRGVEYCRGLLSPFEARELRDWLTKFLSWEYEMEKNEDEKA